MDFISAGNNYINTLAFFIPLCVKFLSFTINIALISGRKGIIVTSPRELELNRQIRVRNSPLNSKNRLRVIIYIINATCSSTYSSYLPLCHYYKIGFIYLLDQTRVSHLPKSLNLYQRLTNIVTLFRLFYLQIRNSHPRLRVLNRIE